MILRDLKIGQCARVVNYGDIGRSFQNKLIALGLHRNAWFKILRKAPMGDPIQICINHTSFSVRMADVATLEVQTAV
jgi:Fe2+ transport system protein FeoA